MDEPLNQLESIVPKETFYYEILDIEYDASQADIKKAYYKKAMKYHPDKNEGNEEAAEIFKNVSEAYQILFDVEKRKNYNLYGMNGVKDDQFVNSKDFFQILFGGGKFQDYFGSVSFNLYDEETEEDDEDLVRDKHKKKISELKEKLIERLELYLFGDINGFKKSIVLEANSLRKESFGKELLETIGYVYKQKGEIFIYSNSWGGIPGLFLTVSERAHIFKGAVNAVSAATELQQATELLQGLSDVDNLTDEKNSKIQEEVQAAMWKIMKIDVEATLRDVCESILNDPSVPKNIQFKRAEALRIWGTIFAQPRVVRNNANQNNNSNHKNN